MTLILKLDLDIVEMYVCTKMKFLPLMVEMLQPEQTERQTDSAEIITYRLSEIADGKYWGKILEMSGNFVSPEKWDPLQFCITKSTMRNLVNCYQPCSWFWLYFG